MDFEFPEEIARAREKAVKFTKKEITPELAQK